MTSVLTADHVSHEYPTTRRRSPGVRSLTDVSLEVRAGERVGLVGRSGSGKSTLLRILLALDEPSSGMVGLDGREVRPTSTRRARWYRRQVQYVPQDPAASLEPRMTVARLVREPLVRLAVPGDHDVAVREALDAVALPSDVLRRTPREISGGQAQRVAMARAIVSGPAFLLADEPVSGLDLPLRDQVLSLLDALSSDRGLGLLFVSHDLEAVARLCGRSVVLSGGRVVEEGPTARLLARPGHAATRELVDSLVRLPPGLLA